MTTDREVLAELVALRDLKVQIESLSYGGFQGKVTSSGGVEWEDRHAECEKLKAEYDRRKPLAWAAAKAQLASPDGRHDSTTTSESGEPKATADRKAEDRLANAEVPGKSTFLGGGVMASRDDFTDKRPTVFQAGIEATRAVRADASFQKLWDESPVTEQQRYLTEARCNERKQLSQELIDELWTKACMSENPTVETFARFIWEDALAASTQAVWSEGKA